MTNAWQFFAVVDGTPGGFTWQWRKEAVRGCTTSAPFSFYFDCISDARAKGYVGLLPPGPKSPLPHMPVVRGKASHATSVPPSGGEAKRLVLRVQAIHDERAG
jgi:hypothetical protein